MLFCVIIHKVTLKSPKYLGEELEISWCQTRMKCVKLCVVRMATEVTWTRLCRFQILCPSNILPWSLTACGCLNFELWDDWEVLWFNYRCSFPRLFECDMWWPFLYFISIHFDQSNMNLFPNKYIFQHVRYK